MAGETDENVDPVAAAERSSPMAAPAAGVEEKPTIEEKKPTEGTKRKKPRGVLSRIWTGVFGSRKDDFERRLERISKEETNILNRMRLRAHNWGIRKRQIILFSIVIEVVTVVYAIATARRSENWQIRVFRVLPMFLLPALSSAMYLGLKGFINMLEQKDQKTLEKLRAERQSKIDELKEKTNYYITQQLIQRYDTDPVAKAAAATVLASKLGSDSGLKLFLESETQQFSPAEKSNDAENMHSSGLRNRKQPLSRTVSLGRATSRATSRAPSLASAAQHSPEPSPKAESEYGGNQSHFVDHYPTTPTAYNGGWFSRFAALLMGEDPTQCYALICRNCHRHNGLVSKEDFPYVTYFCPHCRTINGPRMRQEAASAPNTPNTGSIVSMDLGNANGGTSGSPLTNCAENPLSEAAPLTTNGGDKTELSAAEGSES